MANAILITPLFNHDCSRCAYHGSVNGEDIYTCGDSIIRRTGNDGPDYMSMPIEMAKGIPAYADALFMMEMHEITQAELELEIELRA